MDLIDKNKTMEEFRHFLGHVFHDDKDLKEGLSRFEEEVDGFVLRPFFIKTFKEIDNPELSFMPQIREKHPEARMASSQEIPN